jgi:hypothetical protein
MLGYQSLLTGLVLAPNLPPWTTAMGNCPSGRPPRGMIGHKPEGPCLLEYDEHPNGASLLVLVLRTSTPTDESQERSKEHPLRKQKVTPSHAGTTRLCSSALFSFTLTCYAASGRSPPLFPSQTFCDFLLLFSPRTAGTRDRVSHR